jgi:hypothetical protein
MVSKVVRCRICARVHNLTELINTREQPDGTFTYMCPSKKHLAHTNVKTYGPLKRQSIKSHEAYGSAVPQNDKIQTMQHHHHPNINDTFHSKRTDKGNAMLVLNADNYVMAEYNMCTGETVWQRLVQATQRERWRRG